VKAAERQRKVEEREATRKARNSAAASKVRAGGVGVAPQCATHSSGSTALSTALRMQPGEETARGGGGDGDGDGESWEDGVEGKRRKVGGGDEEGAWPADGDDQECEPGARVGEARSAGGVGELERNRRRATETNMTRCAVFARRQARGRE
jgi:hypothetical protein